MDLLKLLSLITSKEQSEPSCGILLGVDKILVPMLIDMGEEFFNILSKYTLKGSVHHSNLLTRQIVYSKSNMELISEDPPFVMPAVSEFNIDWQSIDLNDRLRIEEIWGTLYEVLEVFTYLLRAKYGVITKIKSNSVHPISRIEKNIYNAPIVMSIEDDFI